MTRPLDPELKTIRALNRAMKGCPEEAQQRVLAWFVSFWTDHLARRERDRALGIRRAA